MEIRFLGHASFELKNDGVTVLIDPWLTGNPKAATSADELEADAIVITHGHGDHFGDALPIAKRTGADVVAIVEIAAELSEDGVEKVHNPNIGGTVNFDWGSVKLVPAWHTSTTPKGTANVPAGVIVTLGGTVVYHLGDTGLFSDLELIGRRHDIDVAIVPIGGHFTMDRHDAVEAARMIGAKEVIPCHYDTFPLVETDAQAFKSEVEGSTSSKVVVLLPGESHTA
ncbi:MAG TPA: metal-dependent hydrolase [Solirubrobacteraceae bacterium]|nr:metal-dependent hydrolase [Solirubrobacteraceae bacterium]